VELTFTKEEGQSFEIGGTASNQILVLAIHVFSVYTDETDGLEYCDIQLGQRLIPKQRICGTIQPNQDAFLIETFDLQDNLRRLVIAGVSDMVRRHFINIDVRQDGLLVKRLRIDPFFGDFRVM
jgi:hypothetical protein